MVNTMPLAGSGNQLSRQLSVNSLVSLPSSGSTVPYDEPSTETVVRNIKIESRPQPAAEGVAIRSRSNTAGPDSIAIENVGRGVKELVMAINKIVQLGITKVAGDTPKVVVIGDQSTGKSSVINAISGIQVPRSTGTCTRCPMQITLTDNKEPNARWRCEVSVRQEFWFDPNRAANPTIQKPPHFYPWEELDTPDVIHFKTVYDKRELQNVVDQAQLATLNPGSDPKTFVPVQSTSGIFGVQYEVEFSPNVVSLDISAPDLPNLSFYDLPGVISQTENGANPYLIKLAKQLVKRYVAKENALVLLACSMESDIQNSSAAGLLRKYGAIDRCLGILTKPDRLPRGDPIDRWESILRGELFQLGYGYHVVKNPSQAELDEGVGHAGARLLEINWFDKMRPWCDRLLDFKDRFGTEKLLEKLSQMLAIQILQSLPSIRERVQQRLSQIDSELAHLPKPPTSDALRIVLDAINAFTTKVSKQMEGHYPENQFRLMWKALRTQFREGIAAQRPTLIVRAAADVDAARKMRAGATMLQTSFSKQKDVISVDDSDHEQPSAQSTPSKKRKVASNSTPSMHGPIGDEYTNRFDLEFIRNALDELSCSDIPGEIDPKAVNRMRLQTIQHWEHPTKLFLDGLDAALRSTINQTLDVTLRAWKTTDLYKETAKLTEIFLTLAIQEQRQMVAPRALRLERHKPMTENTAALKYNENKELGILHEARIHARTNIYFDELDASTGKQTPSSGRQKKFNDVNFRAQLGADPFAREVEAMSKIRGYYNVASMRYIDNICMSIQVELFEKLREGLKDELITVLGITGENGLDTCVRLLADDPARAMRRRTLKADKQKLLAALECLQQLDRKYQQGIPRNSSTQASSNGHPVNGNMNGNNSNGSGVADADPSRQVFVIDEDEMEEM